MRMRTLIPAVLTLALAAACGDQPPQPRTSSAPASASAGATGAPAADPAKPKGDAQTLPANPEPKGSEAKPDPGDANDHSSPQHDARKKKSGD